MAPSEARAPIAVFVGFLMVSFGVMLWKPQPHPPTEAAPPTAQTGQAEVAKQAEINKQGEVAKQAEVAKLASPPAPAVPALEPPAPPQAPAPEARSGPASESKPSAGEPPQFDIVRVEPSGEAVIAGKGDPNAKVELLGQGKVLGEAQADAGGNFVILPKALEPGSYDLSLRQSAGGREAVESKQSVAVSVPRKGGNVVVALAEPGQPTKVLTAPPAPLAADTRPSPQPAPAAAGAVAIRSVELENGNGFFASGIAKPGAPVHIYLNGAHIADVVTAPDGQWSLTLKKGLVGGHYIVRADVGGAATDGKPGGVVARAEVPFDVPVAMADASKAAPSISALAKPEAAKETSTDAGASPTATDRPSAGAANAVVAEIATAVVVSGDNLWNISRARLGQGRRFTQIYAANSTQIRDPKLIYPGQVLVVPAR